MKFQIKVSSPFRKLSYVGIFPSSFEAVEDALNRFRWAFGVSVVAL